jgi:hypothetical protein
MPHSEEKGEQYSFSVGRRIELCKNCPELNKANFCRMCGCFMPVKVRLMWAECPQGKWGKKEPTDE